MQNRKVFTLGTVSRPMGQAPLPGGSAAHFAGSILARHAVCDEGGSYPDAWLVLREEEQQEQLQAASEVHLQQLTLRVLLQLSAYFTQAQPPQMELQALRHSLSHCMTALERRESYSAIHLLAERLDTVKSETEIRQLQETIARRLETITLRETPLPARLPIAAADQFGGSGARAGERPADPRPLGENLPDTRRLRKGPADPRPLGEGFADTRRVGGTQADRPALPHSLWSLRENSDRGAAPYPRFFAKEQTGAFLNSIRMPVPFSMGIAPLFLANRSAVPGNAGSPAKSAFAASERKGLDALTEHKERLLRLLLNTDTVERETIWTLISNQTQLIDRHRDFLREGTHLATEERLTRVIRQSTAREYTKLLFVIEQAVQGKTLPPETLLPAVAPPSSQAPPSPKAKQAALSIVPLSTLEQTRGKARKTALLQVLKNSPAAVRKAFFTLADESAIWGQAPAGESKKARQQRLTERLQESSASQLETLTHWLRQRVSAQETAENGVSAAEMAERKPTAHKPNGNLETQVPAPGNVQSDETAALTALQHFLTESRQEERQGLLQLAQAAPQEERTALLAGLAQLLPLQTPQEQGDWSPSEQLVYLLEKHGDLPSLAEQLRTTEPILAWERRRGEEQKILTRLAQYGESRGNGWAKQKEQLLDGLQESERQILLTRLEHISPPPGKETAVPLTAAQEFDRILEFPTQREYKSFRYQITRYLREQTPPPPPLTERGAHWLEEHRQAERQGAAQAVAVLAARRPAAWRQVFEDLSIFPAVGQERTPRESLAQAVETSAAPLYERLVQELTHRKELPRGLVAQVLPALRQTLPPPAQSTERIVFTPQTVLQERIAGTEHKAPQSFRQNLIARLSPGRETVREIPGTAVQTAPSSGHRPYRDADRRTAPLQTTTASQRQSYRDADRQTTPPQTTALYSTRSNPLRFAAGNTAFSAASAVPVPREPAQNSGRNDAFTQNIWTHHTTTQSVQQNLMARLFPTRETVRELVSRAAGTTATIERWRQGDTAGWRERPEMRWTLGHTTVSYGTLPLLKDRTALWRAARPDPREKDGDRRTAQPLAKRNASPPTASADKQRTRPLYPENETEMALRRTRTGDGIRHVADQVAARTAELTVQRQTPELHLLRTQTKEQAQTLEQQQKSLSDIHAQLERQEKLVQQALRKTDDAPAEVRKLTKAVLREMEGQLQLERQRRGI